MTEDTPSVPSVSSKEEAEKLISDRNKVERIKDHFLKVHHEAEAQSGRTSNSELITDAVKACRSKFASNPVKFRALAEVIGFASVVNEATVNDRVVDSATELLRINRERNFLWLRPITVVSCTNIINIAAETDGVQTVDDSVPLLVDYLGFSSVTNQEVLIKTLNIWLRECVSSHQLERI